MDWQTFFGDLLEQLPPILLALATFVAAWSARSEARKNGAKVEAVHEVVNSRMTELVDTATAEASAAGELRGREAERKEQNGG